MFEQEAWSYGGPREMALVALFVGVGSSGDDKSKIRAA